MLPSRNGLAELALEIGFLRDALMNISTLVRTAEERGEWSAGGDAVHEQLTSFILDGLQTRAWSMARTPATSATDLALKCAVLSDRLDKDQPTVDDQLMMSVCRDVATLFGEAAHTERAKCKTHISYY